jgi:hypothetical protein
MHLRNLYIPLPALRNLNVLVLHLQGGLSLPLRGFPNLYQGAVIPSRWDSKAPHIKIDIKTQDNIKRGALEKTQVGLSSAR